MRISTIVTTGLIGLIGVPMLVAGCGAESATSAAAPAVAKAAPTAVAIATPCTTPACIFTKPSTGFYGLLLPSDAIPHPGGFPRNDFETHLVGVTDTLAYYDSVLKAQGWVFDTKTSTSDPRSLGGYAYSQIYCRPGLSPVANVGVIVGGLNDADTEAATAKRAQIVFMNMDPEGTCPS